MKTSAAAESAAIHARILRHRTLLVAVAALLWLVILALVDDCRARVLGVVGAGEPRARPSTRRRRRRPGAVPGRPEPLFHSRPGGRSGGRDIWVSHRATLSAAWGAPVNLGPTINSAVGRRVPAFSTGRPLDVLRQRPSRAGSAATDIYQSYRADIHDDFGWQTPTNLGANVNTAANDNGPATSRTEAHPQLFFGSERRAASAAPTST